MAFFSEIFFSTLIGKPVYTIDEKYFGTFRDFIIKRQNGNFKITKVRIRTAHGHRIIVPFSEVHSIEANPISLKLNRSLNDIQPVDYDEDELRLKRDFLDQQIIDTNESRVVRVNDIKIVAVGDELFMVAADIGIRGLLRRLGLEGFVLGIAQIFNKTVPNKLIASAYIDPFPARLRHDITLTVAHDQLKKMHPADLADILTDLDHFERLSILQSLPAETMAKTIAELDPGVRGAVLGKLRDETITTVLERLAPDTATDIASELPKRRMHSILTKMQSADAEEIRGLLKFKSNSAGSIMNTEFLALPETLTASAALEELRRKGAQAEQIFYLYIIDGEYALKGVISLRELIFVSPESLISSLIKRKPVYVRARENVKAIAEKLTKYNLIAIPVVGVKKKLVGVITVDDILPLLKTAS